MWPPHGLSLSTPDLVLRGTTEQDAMALAAVVPGDVSHDPSLPDVPPAQKVLLKYWQACGALTRDSWSLWFTVVHRGQVVGAQGLEGKDFPVLRTVDTWSWLVPEARGGGLGKQMRTAVLTLAFDHLSAVRATTEAWSDNAPSLGVSRSLGYVDNGVDLVLRRPGDGVEQQTPSSMQRLVLEREAWRPAYRVDVRGVEPCLPLLGLG